VASERNRPDVAQRRARWIERQGRIVPERLVFIDETWTKTNMAPLRGWAPLSMNVETGPQIFTQKGPPCCGWHER
jgi:putative transposase